MRKTGVNYRKAKLGQLARDVNSYVSLNLPNLLKDPKLALNARNVHVIAHTHWDREWWKTFEDFQKILIPLTFGLMDLLEANPDFDSFMFDGQVAPIDDFLDTLSGKNRNQVTARLTKLIKDGRIYIGPWYTLSDQFLVSGETTIRNLELGISRSKELGQVMNIAYCPDQFGLIQELPKILNLVGITRVVGERGMKRSLPRRFNWITADGSTVEVLNLKDGYFHNNLKARDFSNFARKFGSKPAIFLAGYDHSIPSKDVLYSAIKAGVKLSNLERYWASLKPIKSKTVYRGEIRSAGDKNILPNVISNRVDQRQEVAIAEVKLERYAEPLATLIYKKFPHDLLDQAWKLQIWNAAHDSACATGIDDVTKAVRSRAAKTTEISTTLINSSLEQLAELLESSGTYLWNPSNFVRNCWVRKGRNYWLADSVPPLGWAKATAVSNPLIPLSKSPSIKYVTQKDHGDTYTFSPRGKESFIELPTEVHEEINEPFTRFNVAWNNEEKNHRVRMLIKLPYKANNTITDTAFGHVVRPAVPELIQGRDRLNGYPASKYILAGGLAILLDRVAEYELLPESNELAITLLRAHGALSRLNTKYRLGRAGPAIATFDTQMLKPIEWNFALMPWDNLDEFPWKEWEMFALAPSVFSSRGGGTLSEYGSLCEDIPVGVLSAVLPDGIRVFEAGDNHRIKQYPIKRTLG